MSAPRRETQRGPVRRRPGRAAALIALAGATGAWSQPTDSVLEASQERGFPWIAQSSVEAFYLGSPAGSGTHPYQISAYQGFTIQSLRFAWFHMGLRSRETLAPGLSQSYREPFSIKLAGAAEIMRDFLFLSVAGGIPMFSSTVAAGDSAALYRALSVYSPLPAPDFFSPTVLQGGLYLRYGWYAWEAMAGVSITRPGQFEPIAGDVFYLAPYVNVFLRGVLQTSSARHRWDAKATFYGQESNDIKIPAHEEGDLWQLRYGFLRSLSKWAVQTGVGAALKSRDANRQIKLRSELLATERNDNQQRAYGELSLVYAPHPSLSWRMHLLPKALFSWGGEVGHETELGLALGLKIWDAHRLRVSGSVLYGSVEKTDYLGMGLRAEFAFRHLGFLDLEEEEQPQREE